MSSWKTIAALKWCRWNPLHDENEWLTCGYLERLCERHRIQVNAVRPGECMVARVYDDLKGSEVYVEPSPIWFFRGSAMPVEVGMFWTDESESGPYYIARLDLVPTSLVHKFNIGGDRG